MSTRGPLRDEIRERIRTDLVAGRLRPGEQIRLAPLAERLTVSLTPTREALTQLESEGWVVLHPNRGFFASPLTLAEAEGLYPLIAALEALAVELQGARAAPVAGSLRRINAELEALVDEPDRFFDCDQRWHETLVAGCANPILLAHLNAIRARAERYEREYMRCSGRLPSSTEGHAQIARALEDPAGVSPERLRALLREHWALTLHFLRDWLTPGTH